MSFPYVGRIGARRAAVAAGAVAVLAAAGLTLYACHGPDRPSAASRPASEDRRPVSSSAGTTRVVTVRSTAPAYAGPGARRTGAVPANWFGRPSVLPVVTSRPGWVRVRLAQRPNGSTAWLPTRYVRFGSTPYRIVIDLGSTHLKLYEHDRLVLTAPAGVGTPDDPTPTGTYFVAFREEPPRPNPGYGPFILVTSAHSRAIDDWAGSGDAVIGIHGPLGEDSRIGTSGARISHGCVRLRTAALVRLRDVPAGTPIAVVR